MPVIKSEVNEKMDIVPAAYSRECEIKKLYIYIIFFFFILRYVIQARI